MDYREEEEKEGVRSRVEEQMYSDVQSEDEHPKANGVAEIEAMIQAWNKKSLLGFWATVFILSIALALENQTVGFYTNFATSSFNSYSLLSVLQVVQSIITVVAKPIIAKLADAIGRFEVFSTCALFVAIGNAMLAASPNIQTYFAAQVFCVTGKVGIQFLMGIFACDMTDFPNRAFFTVLPNICYLFVPFCGSPIVDAMLKHSSWRWGIGTWAIAVPICAIPMCSLLFYYRLQAKKLGAGLGRTFNWKQTMLELDLGGSVLLAVGLALVFIAIPMASSDAEEWKTAKVLCMIIIGGLSLIAFPIYEAKWARYPILTIKLMRNIEMLKSFVFIMLYYLAFYIYQPYFYGWLMVVHNLSVKAATNVSVTTTVTSTLSGTLGAIAIKYTRNIKWYIVGGNAIHFIGIGLIFAFRTMNTSVAKLVVAQAVDGIGAGLLTTPNQILVETYCTHGEVAQTIALYSSFLSFGQIIGDAASGSVYRSYYGKYLKQNFPGANATWVDTIMNDYTQALKYPVNSATRVDIVDAYNKVMRILLIPPFAFYAVMFLISVTFPDKKLDKVPHGLKGCIFGEPDKKEVIQEQQQIEQADEEKPKKSLVRRVFKV